MKWQDIVEMPQGELVEHLDQFKQWATIVGGYELKE